MIVHVRNERLAQIANVYENRLYGADFFVSLAEIKSWLSSPMFYWSVCSAVPVPKHCDEILGALSILVVPESQAKALLADEIKESELTPWTPASGEKPVLYFCSYSGSVGGVGRHQFAIAEEYFAGLEWPSDQHPSWALSIAATADGEHHLERCGFAGADGAYLGKYRFYHARPGRSHRLSRLWAALLVHSDHANAWDTEHYQRGHQPALG